MKYPELVTRLTTSCEAWIVGSAAMATCKNPRDYDVFVPAKYWQTASMILPKNAVLNRMGGLKCISEGVEVDVWTGDMHDFLASEYFKAAYNPRTGVRIKRSK